MGHLYHGYVGKFSRKNPSNESYDSPYISSKRLQVQVPKAADDAKTWAIHYGRHPGGIPFLNGLVHRKPMGFYHQHIGVSG